MVYIEFGKAERLKLDANSIFINFKYDRYFQDNLAKIKGYWNRVCHGKPTWTWEVPYSCFNDIKEMFADQEIIYLNDPPKAKFNTEDDILKDLDLNGYKLFDYQVEGIKYGLTHQNWLLLDEQGLGKSLQAIKLAEYKKHHMDLKHCLIVCGVNSLKWNWQREIEKFCRYEKGIVLGTKVNSKGRIVTTTIEETKQQIMNCPEEFFWIINIERMRVTKQGLKEKSTIVDCLNYQAEQGNLGMLVVDEVHKIKDISSQQTVGIMSLDKRISKLLMTGTLLVNNPHDLFCPMSICGLISYNKYVFDSKFIVKDAYGNEIGYQNMDELHNILYKSSLRRTKELLDLPPKIYKQEWLELNKDEQNVFDQIIGKAAFKLDKIEEPNEMVAIITRMRQATVASELLTSKKITSTKFERLNDILEEAQLNNQKVLVFCPFTKALELGLEYCKKYHPKIVKGGMGAGIQKVVDEHENTEGFSILFAQEATLGVGYTLKNTSIVIFLSPPWSRATYDQCVDRSHRYGQKNTVQVIDLLAKDTYDELIYKKLHGKGAMADSLIDGKDDETVRTYLKEAGIIFDKEGHVVKKGFFNL